MRSFEAWHGRGKIKEECDKSSKRTDRHMRRREEFSKGKNKEEKKRNKLKCRGREKENVAEEEEDDYFVYAVSILKRTSAEKEALYVSGAEK